MNRRIKRSKPNAFLLEIILDLIIFAVLLTISLQMIIRAHSLTKQTSDLYQAVEICENISDLYENDSADYKLIKECYPFIKTNSNGFCLYLDKDFLSVSEKENAIYTVVAEELSDTTLPHAIQITCYDEKEHTIHQIRAFRLAMRKEAFV